MTLKINGTEIAVYPSKFTVTTMDLDADTTARTADGTMSRDRITVKTKIEMEFAGLKDQQISALLDSMKDVFFEFYHPNPMEGGYTTKTFYVGNRPASMACEKNGEIIWTGLKISLTEK